MKKYLSFLGVNTSKVAGTWEVIVDTAISKYIPAKTTWYVVATATDINRNTSPLSNMYILGDCYITSLKDTTDNQYPLPNTMRMAMKVCKWSGKSCWCIFQCSTRWS